ncbi:hypothetical protein [Caballeronia sp. LjRoot31]|uniref:hypothetical protein n=1 Tax=Caballeronia sp. LjRoot31 TaxID=3342324 RepID=UPI003ED0C8AA
MDVTVKSGQRHSDTPPASAINRTFLSSPPDVRVYAGTPTENSSKVEFDEARLIWSAEQPDWRSAIASIRPDPNATRFARPADAIPFRREQLYAFSDTISELLELEQSRVLKWQFVTFAEIHLPATRSDDERKFVRLTDSLCGKETQRLIPHLLEAFRQRPTWPEGTWRRSWRERTEFRCGGCDVFVGRPHIPIARLNDLATTEIALSPHLTKRGPNGVWIIGRGVEHELAKRASEITLFCHVDSDGQPVEIQYVDAGGYEATSFDLFSSESDAEQQAREDEQEFEMIVGVRSLSGEDLLALLARADVIYCDDTEVPLTDAGQRFLEVAAPVPNAMSVLDALQATIRR